MLTRIYIVKNPWSSTVMEDLPERVEGTGKQSDDDNAAERLACSIWDSIASSFGKSAAKPAESESPNQWRSSGKEGERSARISMRAQVNVDEKDFVQRNPDAAKGKIEDQVSKTGFKVRHATTGEVDGGWKLDGINKDGTLRLSKDYNFAVKRKEKHDSLVETIPGVPKEHTKALEDKLAQLPENVLKALKDAGYKIIATRFNSDAIPELKTLTPRGWDKTTNFDTSDGTHDNVRRVILAPYMHIPDRSEREVSRPEVLVHQIGHALDHARGKLSNDPEFQKAFQKDMLELAKKGISMTEEERRIFEYFSQKRGPVKGEQPGSEECFASLFGLVLTGPENPEDKKPFEDNFKNTIAVVRKQIEKL